MRVNVIDNFSIVCGVSVACKTVSDNLAALGVKILKNSISSNFDVVAVFGSIDPLSFLFVMRNRISGKPIVMCANTLAGTMSSLNFTKKFNFLLNPYLTAFYKQADIIIAPTDFARNALLSEHSISGKRIEVISNGVDTRQFKYDAKRRRQFRQRLGIADGEIMVCGVGAFIFRKGIETFVNMANRFNNCKFIWAGPAYPEIFVNRDKLNKLRKNIPENLHFLGCVDAEGVRDLQCGSDIFLFPSHYETEGIAVLEAASCGRPLVLRDLEVYDHRFINGKACFRCSTDKDFERALEKLMASERLRISMGKIARTAVLKLDVRKVAKKTLKVYESALELKRIRGR